MIEAHDVSKAYGPVKALHEVSLCAPSGAVTGFVGPNGAGKSTLLRIVAGLSVADRGTVTIDGHGLADAPQAGRLLGVFLSAESIPPRLTARSFLSYVCELQGINDSHSVDALASVGLEYVADRKVKTFSLGMRQRLGIAAAIAGRPTNLVLDEPINGLDPDAIQWLRGIVRSVASEGGTVLLSSHHMSELELVADHVVMIDKGRVVRVGTVDAFVASGQQLTYFESDDLEAAIGVLSAHGMTAERHDRGAVVAGSMPVDVGRLLFTAGPGVSHLRRFDRSIEQTYFDEIARSGQEGAS